MLKIVIFSIPLLALLLNAVERLFFTEKHLENIQKYGVKGTMLRKPLGMLALGSFIVSYWFIGIGFIWAMLAIILILILFIFPEHQLEIPEKGSEIYKSLLQKRKKQSLGNVIFALIWVASWAVT